MVNTTVAKLVKRNFYLLQHLDHIKQKSAKKNIWSAFSGWPDDQKNVFVFIFVKILSRLEQIQDSQIWLSQLAAYVT